MRFGVITKVPPSGEGGNMAVAFPYVQTEQIDASNDYKGKYQPASTFLRGPTGFTLFFGPVFALGEVIIADDHGREVVGQGRKPDKWDVSCEWFSTIDEAIKRAMEVGNGDT